MQFEFSILQSKGHTLVLCLSSSLIFIFFFLLVLKPCKVFPWGVLGKRSFCQRIKHSATCGISNGDKWNRTNGCHSVWRGLGTASNPAAKLWAIQKTSFPHDFQTTRALAHESMTTPFYYFLLLVFFFPLPFFFLFFFPFFS